MNKYIKAELRKMQDKYQRKHEEAQRNYRDTGYDRYYDAQEKYSGLVQGVQHLLDSESYIEKGVQLEKVITRWSVAVENMQYMPPDKRETAINNLLIDIRRIAHDG
ncbi:MAG: hypothetical protein IJ410_03480 [Oscillospiraceae bacterium]|nr:hypothetical protein [Oscillospiraceae bacterium]